MTEPRMTTKNGLSFAMSLIALIGCLIMGGYLYFSNQAIKTSIQAQFKDQWDAQQTNWLLVHEQVDAITEQTQKQQTDIDQLNQLSLDQTKALNNLESTFHLLYPSQLVEWQIKQIEFYLWLAHKRLALTEDLAGTSVLLEQAINIATQIKDPDLDTLLETLQKDRAHLNIENLHNQDTTITRIKAVETAILGLQPNISAQNAHHSDTQQTDAKHVSPINKAIAQLGNALFRVTDLADPVRPVAALEMQKLAKQQATLYLNQAKLYLLNRNYPAFIQSIDACKQLIEIHFSTHNQQVTFALKELKALSSLKFSTHLPTIDASFDAFKRYIALRSAKALEILPSEAQP